MAETHFSNRVLCYTKHRISKGVVIWIAYNYEVYLTNVQTI